MARKLSLASRIRNHILQHIENGDWPPDHRIPAESELMELFAASRMTVHRTLKELAAEGMIYRQRGIGSFVSRRAPRSALLVVKNIAEEIANRGGAYSNELIYLSAEPESELINTIFGKGKSIARSKVVHCENTLPIQLEDRYVDLRTAPDYLSVNFATTTAHAYLMQAAPLQKAEHELTATLPNREQQRFLQIGPHEPCLLLKRKTWSRDRLVSYAELLYPGSRFRFGGVFTPK